MSDQRQVTVPGLPPLLSEGPVLAAPPAQSQGQVVLTAAARADMFLDPAGPEHTADAERFVTEVRGDFIFSAFVKPVFVTDFDSGVLLGYVDPSTWFKLCAELDTFGVARVVSVVTRNGLSDDSDSVDIDRGGVFLRIARLGSAFAMHCSSDGVHWRMVRYFALGAVPPASVKVGIMAQSPSGEGTTATFSELLLESRTLGGVRDGS